MKKNDKPLKPEQGRFLAAFAQCGSITEAARQAEIRSASHYQWLKRKNGGTYAKAFKRVCNARLKAAMKALDKSFDLFDRTGQVDETLAKYLDKGTLKTMAWMRDLKKRIDKRLAEGKSVSRELRRFMDRIWPT
jgi:hypothetical protein